MEKTHVMAEFIITGDDFPIEEVSKRLSLEPIGYYVKGEKIRGGIERAETCWFITTGYEESIDINDQINKLIDQLKEKVVDLLAMQSEYELEYKFCVVIKIEQNEKPAIYLTQETINFAHSLKAWFDFDLYIY